MSIYSKILSKYFQKLSKFPYVLNPVGPAKWSVESAGSYFPDYPSLGITGPRLKIVSGLLENPSQQVQNFVVETQNLVPSQLPGCVIRVYGSDDGSVFSEIGSEAVTPSNLRLEMLTTHRYLVATVELGGQILYSTEDLKKGYRPLDRGARARVYVRSGTSSGVPVGVFPVFLDEQGNLLVDASYRNTSSFRSPATAPSGSLDVELQAQTLVNGAPSFVQIGQSLQETSLPSDLLIPVDSFFAATNSSFVNRVSLTTLAETLVFLGKYRVLDPAAGEDFSQALTALRGLAKASGLFYSSYNKATLVPLTTSAPVYDNLYLLLRFLESGISELVEFVTEVNTLSGSSYVQDVLSLVDQIPASPTYGLIKDGYVSGGTGPSSLFPLRNQILLYMLYLSLGADYLGSASDLREVLYQKYLTNRAEPVMALGGNYVPSSLDYAFLVLFASSLSDGAAAAPALGVLQTDFQVSGITEIPLILDPNNASYNVHYPKTFSEPQKGFKTFSNDSFINTETSLLIKALIPDQSLVKVEQFMTEDGYLLSNGGNAQAGVYVFPSLYSTLLSANATLSNNKLFPIKTDIRIDTSALPITAQVVQRPTSNGVIAEVFFDSPAGLVIYAVDSTTQRVYDLKYLNVPQTQHMVFLKIPKTPNPVHLVAHPIR